MEAELDEDRTIPLLVVHSLNDEVVRIRAAELIRDAYMKVFARDYDTAIEEVYTAEGIACTHTKYKDRSGGAVVETVLFDGAVAETQCGSLGCGHYYSGEEDDPKAWAYGRGPSTTRIAWEFFSRHTLSGDEAP